MKVLGFGAVLWDEIRGEQWLGGAVFNLVAHSRRLNSEAYIISAVGDDALGKKTLEAIKEEGVDVGLVKVVDVPTCVVKITFDKSGDPSYSLEETTSWDFITVTDSDLQWINENVFDFFCFGTLEQRHPVSRQTLAMLLNECRFKKIFLDMNLRLPYYSKKTVAYSLKKCNIVKMSEEEAVIVRNLFHFPYAGHQAFLTKLCQEFDIEMGCITLGKHGAFLGSNTCFVHCLGYNVSVEDTVGAGDAFSAGLLTELHAGATIQEAGDFACRLGALIVSKRGAIPDFTIRELNELAVLT